MLSQARAVVERPERGDRARHEAEHLLKVGGGCKREPPRPDAALYGFERHVGIVGHADEVIRALLVVAQKEVLGAKRGERDLRPARLVDGEHSYMFGELIGDALAVEQLKHRAFVIHRPPPFPFGLVGAFACMRHCVTRRERRPVWRRLFRADEAAFPGRRRPAPLPRPAAAATMGA